MNLSRRYVDRDTRIRYAAIMTSTLEAAIAKLAAPPRFRPTSKTVWAAGCFTNSRATSSGPGRLKPRRICSASSPLKRVPTERAVASPTSIQTACEVAGDSADAETGGAGRCARLRRVLQVDRCQTGVLGDSGKNARTEFLAVMKGEDKVWSIRTGERPVRARLALDHPADSLQRGENPPRLVAGQLLTPPGT